MIKMFVGKRSSCRPSVNCVRRGEYSQLWEDFSTGSNFLEHSLCAAGPLWSAAPDGDLLRSVKRLNRGSGLLTEEEAGMSLDVT